MCLCAKILINTAFIWEIKFVTSHTEQPFHPQKILILAAISTTMSIYTFIENEH